MDDARVKSEIDALFSELDQLLKNADVATVLAEQGINISLALVAADPSLAGIAARRLFFPFGPDRWPRSTTSAMVERHRASKSLRTSATSG